MTEGLQKEKSKNFVEFILSEDGLGDRRFEGKIDSLRTSIKGKCSELGETELTNKF